MPLPLSVALSAATLIALFSAVWLWQLRSQNAGMIDPVWAFGLALVAILTALTGTGAPSNRLLIAIGGTLWGLRLAHHLWQRNFGHPEDARYRQFRDQWGTAAPSRFFWFFQLQALVALILAIAFFVPAFRPEPVAAPDAIAAIAIWLVSVIGEGVADRQLARFTANRQNKGEVCRTGLWRYSRHPNYFFECLHWFAYTALAIRLPWGWLTLIPPFVMAWLLMKLSGIPLLEARLIHTRPGYDDYIRTTSALIPWPPRRSPPAGPR